MSELVTAARRFRFADFELNLEDARLCRNGRPIHLRPQALRVLALLVGRHGALVTRDEIRSQIWTADTFVDFNQGLNACVMQIREALDDDPESPHFVETVRRLGYRFIANVEPVTEVAVVDPPASPTNGADSAPASRTEADALSRDSRASPLRARVKVGVALAGLGVLAALTLASLWPLRLQSDPVTAAVRSIAVLPLVNLGGGAEGVYLADGMTDALINELARGGGLRIISRTSSMQYRDPRKPIPQIARELRVDAVIEGSVQQSANRVRITVQLIDGATDQPLWASSYDRDLKDVLALQHQVSNVIVREIRAQLPPESGQEPRVVAPAAYEAYLKGRFFWDKRTRDGFENAIHHFEEAIRLDPGYAQAYSGLADTLTLATTSEYLPPDEGYKRAKDAALTALSLDETLAEAHTSLGFILNVSDYDWAGAEREFVRAIQLNPNYAPAHHWRALNFRTLGKFEDAYAALQEAIARDPLSYAINVDFAVALTAVGRCDDAYVQAAKTDQMHELGGRGLLAELLVFCRTVRRRNPAAGESRQKRRNSIPHGPWFSRIRVCASRRRTGSATGDRGFAEASAKGLAVASCRDPWRPRRKRQGVPLPGGTLPIERFSDSTPQLASDAGPAPLRSTVSVPAAANEHDATALTSQGLCP